jgi:hypothetical protein
MGGTTAGQWLSEGYSLDRRSRETASMIAGGLLF